MYSNTKCKFEQWGEDNLVSNASRTPSKTVIHPKNDYRILTQKGSK